MSFPANTTFAPGKGQPFPIRPDTASSLLAALREYLEADKALRALPPDPTFAWGQAEARYRAAREAAQATITKAEWGL